MREEKIVLEYFVPEHEYLTIDAESKNPLIVVKKLSSYYRKHFEVKGSKIWEKYTNYDTTDGSFFIRYDITPEYPPEFPVKTFLQVKVVFENVFKGKAPLNEGEIGKINIKIRAYISFTFIARNFLEKIFHYLYYYTFYKHRKDEIIKEVKKVLETIKEDMIKDLTT